MNFLCHKMTFNDCNFEVCKAVNVQIVAFWILIPCRRVFELNIIIHLKRYLVTQPRSLNFNHEFGGSIFFQNVDFLTNYKSGILITLPKIRNLTNELNTQNRDLLEKLKIVRKLRKFFVFHLTRRPITVFIITSMPEALCNIPKHAEVYDEILRPPKPKLEKYPSSFICDNRLWGKTEGKRPQKYVGG